MATPSIILTLANRDSELSSLRRALKPVEDRFEIRLIRNATDLVREFEKGGCGAVLFTTHSTHLKMAQSLAELHRLEPLFPVFLVAGVEEAPPLFEVLKGGLAGVVYREALGLLPSLLERESRRFAEAVELRRQQRRGSWLDAAVGAAPVALAVAQADGILRWANAAYLALIGAAAADLEAGRLQLWAGGEDRWGEVHAAVHNGQVWRGAVPAEGPEAGRSLHQLLVAELAGIEAGPLYIVVRQADGGAAAATPAGLAAAQRHELFSAIAGGIAHDLNNILAPITMAANLLGEQPLSEEDIELVRTIEYGAERGAAVIRQVLTFARGSENCEMVLQPRYIVREVARLAAEIFPPDFDVRAELPSSLWSIVGDPAEIHQALVNVLLNSRDAMPEGGHIVITASNRTVPTVPESVFFGAGPGEFVEIAIEDDGPGLDPEVASRVWEPFVTTKGTGQGAGLGLSRVAGVLRSHGGFGQIHSTGGRGSRISLFFPRHTAAAEVALGDGVVAEPEVGRILVVDDEPDILKLSSRILESAGFDVLVASDGREALGVFMRHRAEIGLVLTDLAMPGMNGFTLIWALRRAKPDLRVMVATGQGTEANLRELELMGVREVLLKPFSRTRLVDAISRTLAGPVQCDPDLFLDSALANEA